MLAYKAVRPLHNAVQLPQFFLSQSNNWESALWRVLMFEPQNSLSSHRPQFCDANSVLVCQLTFFHYWCQILTSVLRDKVTSPLQTFTEWWIGAELLLLLFCIAGSMQILDSHGIENLNFPGLLSHGKSATWLPHFWPMYTKTHLVAGLPWTCWGS